ncbi:MAG: hypothetical protein MHM6MM_003561 [Cercozoa sp. M6MM]
MVLMRVYEDDTIDTILSHDDLIRIFSKRDKDGYTALMTVAQLKHARACRLILRVSPPKTQLLRTDAGESAFHFVIVNEDSDCAAAFLEQVHWDDFEYTRLLESQGMPPLRLLHIAIDTLASLTRDVPLTAHRHVWVQSLRGYLFEHCYHFAQCVPVLQRMVASGTKLLELATLQRPFEVLEMLVLLHVRGTLSVDVVDQYSTQHSLRKREQCQSKRIKTLLHQASSNGEVDLVSALLDAGFHPDSGKQYGQTPLEALLSTIVLRQEKPASLPWHTRLRRVFRRDRAVSQKSELSVTLARKWHCARLLIDRGASVRVRGQWRDALCEAISHEVKTITHVLSHPCGHLSADVATRVASFTALCVPLGINEQAIAQMVHAAMLETAA